MEFSQLTDFLRNYNGKNILFIHYAIRDFEKKKFEFIAKDPNYLVLDNLFKKHEADVYVYGHEHIASFFEGKKKFVDVGSLGCPTPEKDTARYAIMIISDDDVKVEYFKFKYNSQKIVDDMFEKKMPNASFIAKNFYLYEGKK